MSVRAIRSLAVVHPLGGSTDRYLIDLRDRVQLVCICEVALRQLATNLRVRGHLLLVDLLALSLFHLFEAHVVLLLLSPAAELVGQAPLLLDGLGVLDDGHILRIVEVYLWRLRVWVHCYWVRVRELVALGAAVVGLDHFAAGRIARLARRHAVVEAVNVGILLGLLVDGLGSRVACRWWVARGHHGILGGGRRHVCLVVLEHCCLVVELALRVGHLLEVQEALRTSGNLVGLRLRLVLPICRAVTASEPPSLLHLGLVILLILQLCILQALVALAHRKAWAGVASRGWLCRIVLVLNLLMYWPLGAHLHSGREQRLATSERHIATVELAHAATKISTHASKILTHLNIVIVLRPLQSALRAKVHLRLRWRLVDPVCALLAVGGVLDLAVLHREHRLDLALCALVVVVRAAAGRAAILLAGDLAALWARGAELVRVTLGKRVLLLIAV